MDGILKGQKVPTFNGKPGKFPQWSFTFLSICSLAGLKEVWTEDNYGVPAHDINLDPAAAADIPRIEKRKQNQQAFALLAMSIEDDIAFTAVRNAKNPELPDGCARKAWKMF